MQMQPHPTFGTWLQHFFVRAWLVAVVLFIGGLLLLKSGFHGLGWTLAIGFGVTVVGTLGYLTYRLYNVDCPRCGGRTRTMKDSAGARWIAHCNQCNATWDLGVGVGSD